MIRLIVVIAALVASVPAHAVPCWMVRRAVAQYGESAVEAWARAKGLEVWRAGHRRLRLADRVVDGLLPLGHPRDVLRERHESRVARTLEPREPRSRMVAGTRVQRRISKGLEPVQGLLGRGGRMGPG